MANGVRGGVKVSRVTMSVAFRRAIQLEGRSTIGAFGDIGVSSYDEARRNGERL